MEKKQKSLMFRIKKITTIKSSVSGEINIGLVFGKPRIEIGGLLQSGSLTRQIWQKAAKKSKKILGSNLKTVLVFGLGGGTVVEELVRYYPDIKVTAIELDPAIIKIGRKYFQLKIWEKQGLLKIITGDAWQKINTLLKNKQKFDLIIYDLYLGKSFITPDQDFLTKLLKIKANNGLVLFNHFYWGVWKNKAGIFTELLEKYFPRISLSRVLVNLLIFCQ